MLYYTIGEIHRLGLLTNHKGVPYNNKGTISKVVNKMNFKLKKTPWGEAKALTMKQIKKHNTNIAYR